MKATKRKVPSKSKRAQAFMESNPAASVNEVANRFGMPKQSVYGLRNVMRKKGFVFPKKSEPKRYIMSRSQLELAQKMGFSGQDYAQALADMGMLEEAPTEDSQELEQTGIEMYEDAVDATLDARALDYGAFKDGAALMQGIKRQMAEHAQKHGKTFADDQWEALEMIVHKIGRIVNGNPDKVDHWTDIAGYAKLVADRLEGVVR